MSNTLGRWVPLKNNYVKDKTPISAVPADNLVKIANILNTLIVRGGSILRTPDGIRWQIVVDQNKNDGPYSFKVIQRSDTEISCVSGYCQYASSAEVSKSTTDFTVSADGSVYISLELSSGTFTGPLFGVLPTEDDDTSVWRIADVTFSGGAITSIVQRHFGDIYESRA